MRPYASLAALLLLLSLASASMPPQPAYPGLVLKYEDDVSGVGGS